MTAISPFHMFSPIHVACLHQRHENGLDVTAADLDSIEAHQPEAVNDPLFQEYRARLNAGKLYRRRGRKRLSVAERLRLWAAQFAIEEERERIHERRRSGQCERRYGEKAPCIEAAEKVAREYRYGSGEALLNRLSREGIGGNSVKGSKRRR